MNKTAMTAADDHALSLKTCHPLWDYVLMRVIRVDKTKGGLVVPDGAKVDECARSIVVAAGPGIYKDNGTFVPNPLQVGDVVYHMARVNPTKIILDGELHLLVAARDCIAIANRPQSMQPPNTFELNDKELPQMQKKYLDDKFVDPDSWGKR